MEAFKQQDNFITDPIEQIKLLHGDTDGWIALAHKRDEESFYQRHYKLDDIGKHIADWAKQDSYISMNTFYTPKRLATNLREIRTFYTDLDCYNVNLTADQVVMQLKADYFDSAIPAPNLINYSGRGINLIWFLEPLSGLAVERWGKLQKSVRNALKQFGSDDKATDTSRVFRLSGSINSKSNSQVVTEVLHTYKYSFDEVADEYFPEIKIKPANPKRKRKSHSKVKHIFNEYTLTKARMKDIETIIEVRHGNLEGFREVALFLYRYWSIVETGSYERALNAIYEVNNLLDEPLPVNEVARDTKSAEMYYQTEEGLNITNETIIDWLDIKPEEQKQLQTIISKSEKNRRKLIANTKANREKGVRPMSQYNADRKQQNQDKVTRLKQLLESNPNATKTSLAEKLGISRNYLYKLLKKV